jgi:hypothetical protein
MGIATLLGYLIGNRNAILRIAGHPHAWVVGMVFVLSAALARDYDGEDLLHEPWHLLLPFAASLPASFLLYCILYGFSTPWRKDGPTFLFGYRSFLGLFWMTAPLAWLYAIPYERFLDPLEATQANLMTLAVVAAWRVALMIRVGVVLMGLSIWKALFRVMAYADGTALLAMCFLPFPLIQFMGGINATTAEKAVHEATVSVLMFGGCSFPVWFILAAGGALEVDVAGQWRVPVPSNSAVQGVSWPLRVLAFSSLAIWITILPLTQPEQQLGREVETAFREKRIGDGLAIMSANNRSDFPPGWEPPPRFLKGEDSSLTLDVWKEMLANEPSKWVRDLYKERLDFYLRRNSYFLDKEKLADVLNRMPEDEALASLRLSQDEWLYQSLDLRPELMNRIIEQRK